MQTKTRKGIRLLFSTIFLFLAFYVFLFSLPTAASAVSLPEVEDSPYIADETFTPLDNDAPDPLGWLVARAVPPSGFEGVICVELQNKSTGTLETVQLDPPTSYIGGSRLPVSTYTVKRTYVLNSDHFSVSCSAEEILITSCEDTFLTLTITPDAGFEEYLAEKKSAFTPRPSASLADELLIWDYLLDLTGNPCGAAALMGHLYAESCLCATNLQNSYEGTLCCDDLTYTKAVDDGTYLNFTEDRAGYGLAQWTDPVRKANLYAYAESCGKSIGDLQMQLGFLAQELSGGSILAALQSASSVREASDVVLEKYEAPLDQSDNVKTARASFGEYFYNRFALGNRPEETIVQGQADVIRVATNSSHYEIAAEAGFGQRWAAQVYAAAGFPLDSSCCAYHSAVRYGVSDDWGEIPPGATVYGYSGSQYGHVGIYVGSGLVYHNIGGVAVDTLTDWVNTYDGFCWGWEAGSDLTQVP